MRVERGTEAQSSTMPSSTWLLFSCLLGCLPACLPASLPDRLMCAHNVRRTCALQCLGQSTWRALEALQPLALSCSYASPYPSCLPACPPACPPTCQVDDLRRLLHNLQAPLSHRLVKVGLSVGLGGKQRHRPADRHGTCGWMGNQGTWQVSGIALYTR